MQWVVDGLVSVMAVRFIPRCQIVWSVIIPFLHCLLFLQFSCGSASGSARLCKLSCVRLFFWTRMSILYFLGLICFTHLSLFFVIGSIRSVSPSSLCTMCFYFILLRTFHIHLHLICMKKQSSLQRLIGACDQRHKFYLLSHSPRAVAEAEIFNSGSIK